MNHDEEEPFSRRSAQLTADQVRGMGAFVIHGGEAQIATALGQEAIQLRLGALGGVERPDLDLSYLDSLN